MESDFLLRNESCSWQDIFEAETIRVQNLITKTAQGRGTTYFYNWKGRSMVLRRYLRGGFMAKFGKDRYLWTGASRTRPEHELRILQQIQSLKLPGPKPIGARTRRSGLFCRGEIVTEELVGVTPLGEILENGPLSESGWSLVGKTIRRFHDNEICHKDLNANNIMLGGGQCYLIDFDRATIGVSGSWKEGNLERLLRSLNKQQGLRPGFHFNSSAWECLRTAYE